MYKIYIYMRKIDMKNYAPVKRPERTVVVRVNNYDYVYLTER